MAVEESTSPFPDSGQSGCTTTHEAGSVAWSSDKFNSDNPDWLLYCNANTDQWTASKGNRASRFATLGQKWAQVNVDKDKTQADSPQSWMIGSHFGHQLLNAKCANQPPTGYHSGGALYICLDALRNDQIAARICSQGQGGDTPDCGPVDLDQGALIGTQDCPIKA